MTWTIQQAIILSQSNDPVLRQSANEVLAAHQQHFNSPEFKQQQSGEMKKLNKLLERK